MNRATPGAGRGAPSPWLLAALFCLLALALRAATFGNPLIQIDEQFYALVGGRMLTGALPYVDIWDRKPFGLFVLFAGLRALAPHTPLPYQLAAALCAGLTGFVISRIARAIAPAGAAALAGIAYLLWLPVFNCIGAQTPVFYNLPMVLAALLTLRAARGEGGAWLPARGAAAMLLVGLALQLKPTVVFEGGAMGLVLLWRARADGARAARIAALAALWIGAALAPNVLALAFFAARGHAGPYLDANFLSIFHRHDTLASTLTDLAQTIALLLPFALAIALARRHGDGNRQARALMAGWVAVALGGYLAFGTYYDHYAAPLLVPLCVAAAPALGWRGRAGGMAALLLGGGALLGALIAAGNMARRGNAADLARAAALIRPQLHGACLYVFEGDPALYDATGSCLPTRFPFPPHLHSATESRTIDQPGELARLLARGPGVIVLPDHSRNAQPNLTTLAMLRRALAQHYALYASTTIGGQRYLLYRRAAR